MEKKLAYGVSSPQPGTLTPTEAIERPKLSASNKDRTASVFLLSLFMVNTILEWF